MIPNLFERIQGHIEGKREGIAVIDCQGRYSWRQLADRASGYAHELNSIQASPIVNVLVSPRFESVAAMLGVLLSGRTFSPLLADIPIDRLKSCLGSAEANVLIDTREAPSPTQEIPGVRVISSPSIQSQTAKKLPAYDPNRLAYVLFTSGSTGVPKGVKLSFGNLENTLLWAEETWDWKPTDVVGVASNFSFDISMFDLWCLLWMGLPIALFSLASSPDHSIREIKQFGVTSIFTTPAFFSRIVQYDLLHQIKDTSLRRILSGGDFFPTSHLLAWLKHAPHVEVFNVWGPTETSVVNTSYRVSTDDLPRLEKGEFVSVGESTKRMPLVVLDEADQPVLQPGVKGEVCLYGTCVSQGYLNVSAEEQARAYFTFQGERAFRTGDIGYLDADQRLYIVGRKGSTVKIRGYRVDLAEVERVSETLSGVSIAGAFVQGEDPEFREIWLGIESPEPESFDVFAFKQELRKLLPSYMIPKRVLPMKRLPRNENGKIDRKSLASLSQTTP